ncbi:hypothetical protein T439DRAFT_306320 [Meredithblackwellia eburnea MCA 4105]
MPPAARLSFVPARLPSISGIVPQLPPTKFRVQGWDPILIISQIVSLQALHYLSLSLLMPPLLSLFASPTLLAYEGGPTSISMIMDWREFSGSSTVALAARRGELGGLVGLGSATAAAAAKAGVGAGVKEVTMSDLVKGLVRVVEPDPMRGWVVALAWILASLVDIVPLYTLVRRPTHILDFSLTLIFNHLILTTYYSHAFPTSPFFWFIITISTVTQIVLAEQCCVKREMDEGFSIAPQGAALEGWSTPAVSSSRVMENSHNRRESESVELMGKYNEREREGNR